MFITYFRNIFSATILSVTTYLFQFVATLKLSYVEFSFFQLGNSFSKIIQACNFGLMDFVIAEISVKRDKINLQNIYAHLFILLFSFLSIGFLIILSVLPFYNVKFNVILISNISSGFLFAFLSFNLFFSFACGNYKNYRIGIIITSICGALVTFLFWHNKEMIYLFPFVPAIGIIYGTSILWPRKLKLKLKYFSYFLSKVHIYGIMGLGLILQSQVDKLLMFNLVSQEDYSIYGRFFVYFLPLTFIYSQLDKNIYVDLLSTKENIEINQKFWIRYTRSVFTLSTIFICIFYFIFILLNKYEILNKGHSKLLFGILVIHFLGYVLSPIVNYIWVSKNVKYQFRLVLTNLVLSICVYIIVAKISRDIFYFLLANIFLQIFILICYLNIFFKKSKINPTFFKSELFFLIFAFFIVFLKFFELNNIFLGSCIIVLIFSLVNFYFLVKTYKVSN